MPTDTAKLLFTFFMAPWLVLVSVASENLPGTEVPYLTLSYFIFGITATRIWRPEDLQNIKTLARKLLTRWALPLGLLIIIHYMLLKHYPEKQMSAFTIGILSGGLFIRASLISAKKMSQQQYQYIMDNNIGFEPQKELFLCPACKMDLTGMDTLNCPGCSRSYTIEEYLNLHNNNPTGK